MQALPTALMKPLSGSGARAMMLENMNTHGVDSFPATLAAILQGSTETTFYVLAVQNSASTSSLSVLFSIASISSMELLRMLL